ncbi:hypothetical protein R3P38DRAFT_933029 [Favolaschia claudopus]|uniref:MYND-type domain-containing protein n=1 Tax=Favolaschia claudopus TaxID=2862362 RepID=A0AAW0BPI9_9AGAR
MLHSSLSQLRVSLNAIGNLETQVMDLKINSPPAYRHWDRFISVVQDRFTALDEYNAGNLKIPIACHNYECTGIFLKPNIKVCRGCNVAFYCSKACQKADWRAGHRRFCATVAWGIKRSHPHHPQMSARDRSFLHTLLYHEFCTRRNEIAFKHIQFARKNPTKMPYTLYDFRGGPCNIVIASLEELDSGLTPEGVMEVMEREERILFSFMRSKDEGRGYTRLFPTFIADRDFMAGLRAIVAGIPSDADTEDRLNEYCAAVVSLMHCTPASKPGTDERDIL